MAHYSSKPCDEENCCCGGTITVDQCYIEWTTHDSLFAKITKDGDDYATGLFGLLNNPLDGLYELKVQCVSNGAFIVADSVNWIQNTNVEECCVESPASGPSCLSQLLDITGWRVTIDGYVACSSVANGTYILDASTLVINSMTHKQWLISVPGNCCNLVDVCFEGGPGGVFKLWQNYHSVTVNLFGVGPGRCRLIIGGGVSYTTSDGSVRFTILNATGGVCASSGTASAVIDLSFLSAEVAALLNCTVTSSWEPL